MIFISMELQGLKLEFLGAKRLWQFMMINNARKIPLSVLIYLRKPYFNRPTFEDKELSKIVLDNLTLWKIFQNLIEESEC